MNDDTKPQFLGTANFDKIIRNDAFYIDKSLFIKHFIKGWENQVYLRPRRFGKSTNLAMLRSFLSRGSELKFFKHLKISEESKICDDHCGKYSVIYLDFKDSTYDTWDKTLSDIWRVLRVEVKRHIEDLGPDVGELKLYNFDSLAVPDGLDDILPFLMDALYKKFKEGVIMLIDEYDAPLNHAFRKNFHDIASTFFRNLYSKALKGQTSLEKACLMGIYEVRGGSILSGLNNLHVCSVADEEGSAFFGFTPDEIKPYTGAQHNNVLRWYNGYNIGSLKMINPLSFSYWLASKKLKAYWIGSSNVESLNDLLAPSFLNVIEGVLKFSHDMSYRHKIPVLQTSVHYENSPENISNDSTWMLLILAGYLSYEDDLNDPLYGYAYIPNYELQIHWKSELRKLFLNRTKVTQSEGARLAQDLRDLQADSLSTFLQNILLRTLSHHDLHVELALHMLAAGVICMMFIDSPDTNIESNIEAGHGRLDLLIQFTDLKRLIIIEFKKSINEDRLADDAQNGLDQIRTKKYYRKFSGYDCLLIGVAFAGKRLSDLAVDRIQT